MSVHLRLYIHVHVDMDEGLNPFLCLGLWLGGVGVWRGDTITLESDDVTWGREVRE